MLHDTLQANDTACTFLMCKFTNETQQNALRLLYTLMVILSCGMPDDVNEDLTEIGIVQVQYLLLLFLGLSQITGNWGYHGTYAQEQAQQI